MLNEEVQEMDIPTPGTMPGSVHKQQWRTAIRHQRVLGNDFQFHGFCPEGLCTPIRLEQVEHSAHWEVVAGEALGKQSGTSAPFPGEFALATGYYTVVGALKDQISEQPVSTG